MFKRILVAMIFSMAAAYAQTPAFEVATVKLSPQMTPDLIISGKLHVGMKTDAGRVDLGYMSLRDLIPLAYGVKPFQVTGPDWMGTQRFDILAKLPEGATKEQVPAMLQALLTERFGLTVHRESKEVPVYALTVAKGGPKFKESAPEPDAPPAKEEGGIVVGTGDQQVRLKQNGVGGGIVASGGPGGATRMTMGAGGTMRMEMAKMTMPALAAMLTPMLDRPVLDKTGLAGTYQLALELAMQDMMQAAQKMGAGIPGLPPRPAGPAGQAVPAASDPSGGSIFQSVQQLGLKLDKEKAPFETIVVDRLEKNPSDN